VQNQKRKDVPRLDLAQEDVLGRRPLYRPPSVPRSLPLIEKLVKIDNNTDNKFA
jgi:hypothetical protein